MRYNFFSLACSIIRSIPLNIQICGIQKGWKLPILVHWNSDIKIEKNSLRLPDKIYFGMVKIGLNKGHFGRGNKDRSFFHVQNAGSIIFNGKCNFAAGSIINVNGGKLVLGNHVSSNDRMTLSCEKNIEISSGVMIGWDVLIIDGDGHKIVDKNNLVVNDARSIVIGEESWISSEVKIMKGSAIPAHSVIAMGSIVTKQFTTENVIIAGNPAKVVKHGVRWVGRSYEE